MSRLRVPCETQPAAPWLLFFHWSLRFCPVPPWAMQSTSLSLFAWPYLMGSSEQSTWISLWPLLLLHSTLWPKAGQPRFLSTSQTQTLPGVSEPLDVCLPLHLIYVGTMIRSWSPSKQGLHPPRELDLTAVHGILSSFTAQFSYFPLFRPRDLSSQVHYQMHLGPNYLPLPISLHKTCYVTTAPRKVDWSWEQDELLQIGKSCNRFRQPCTENSCFYPDISIYAREIE